MIDLTATEDIASFDDPVTMPEDFVDPRTAASLQAGRQRIVDQVYTAFQLAKDGASGRFYAIAPESYGNGVWLPNDDRTVSLNYIAIQDLTDTAGKLWIPFQMPPPSNVGQNATTMRLRLTGFGMKIDPANTILPGGMPVISIYAIDRFGDAVLVDSKTDPSATDGDYAATHDVEKTGLTIELASALSFPLWARIRGESLTDFTAGLKLFSAWVDVQVVAG